MFYHNSHPGNSTALFKNHIFHFLFFYHLPLGDKINVKLFQSDVHTNFKKIIQNEGLKNWNNGVKNWNNGATYFQNILKINPKKGQ